MYCPQGMPLHFNTFGHGMGKGSWHPQGMPLHFSTFGHGMGKGSWHPQGMPLHFNTFGHGMGKGSWHPQGMPLHFSMPGGHGTGNVVASLVDARLSVFVLFVLVLVLAL